MTNDANDLKVDEANKEQRRATILSWVWWVQAPVIAITYFFISDAPLSEKLMLIYLAVVSIIANAVSYASKAQAAKATKASYENP